MVQKSANVAIILVVLLAAIMVAGCLDVKSETKPVEELDEKQVRKNHKPYQPALLTQYKSDGSTTIAIGGLTNDGTVVMKGITSDPDEDDVRLDVEIRPVGVPFSNTATCISGSAVASENSASANCPGLADGQYHWQARANDSYDTVGNWLSAGENQESSPDLIIDTTLNNWQYDRQLTIIGSTSGAQTNYQMKLIVYNTSGTDKPGKVYLKSNARSDFGDLRFTKSDGITPLDYWIESYTPGTSAIVWVEIDSIPASPNSTSIYLYYGNSSAMGVSSGAGTFVFFDDFEGYNVGDLNGQGGWSGSNIFNVQTFVVYQGTKAVIGNPDLYGHISKSFSPNLKNVKIVWAQSKTHLRHGALGFIENLTLITFAGLDDNDNTALKFRDNTGYFGSASNNTWFLFELVIRNNNTHDVKVGNSNLHARANAADMVSGINKVDLWVSTVYELNYFDYIRVQKYAEPEPAWT